MVEVLVRIDDILYPSLQTATSKQPHLKVPNHALPAGGGDAYLIELGDFLLMETGDKYLLE